VHFENTVRIHLILMLNKEVRYSCTWDISLFVFSGKLLLLLLLFSLLLLKKQRLSGVAGLCCTATFCFCVTSALYVGTNMFLAEIVKFPLNLEVRFMQTSAFVVVYLIAELIQHEGLLLNFVLSICKFRHVILVTCIRSFIVLFDFLFLCN